MTLDSHQHFWQYDAVVHDWISNDMAVIRKDFLPSDLEPVLEHNGVEGCIAVQADQSEKETGFLLELAGQYDFIKAVVGWVDLKAANIKDRLLHYSQFDKLKGFRHVLQGEQPEFMLHPDFIRGIVALREFGFTYDILIFPEHLPAALQLVKQFPDQPFVIDHIAKPGIKNGLKEPWKKDLQAIAKYQNVCCKISGMVTEAGWKDWKKEDFSPYMEVVVGAFGMHRIMFGSDWPVCLLAADYGQVLNMVQDYFSSFTAAEQALVFGGNAIRFYQIK